MLWFLGWSWGCKWKFSGLSLKISAPHCVLSVYKKHYSTLSCSRYQVCKCGLLRKTNKLLGSPCCGTVSHSQGSSSTTALYFLIGNQMWILVVPGSFSPLDWTCVTCILIFQPLFLGSLVEFHSPASEQKCPDWWIKKSKVCPCQSINQPNNLSKSLFKRRKKYKFDVPCTHSGICHE